MHLSKTYTANFSSARMKKAHSLTTFLVAQKEEEKNINYNLNNNTEGEN